MGMASSPICCISHEMILVVQPLGNKYNTIEDVSPLVNFVKEFDISSSTLKGLAFHGNSYGSTSIIELVRSLIERGPSFLKDIRSVDCSDMFTGRLKEDVPKSLDAIGRLLEHCPAIDYLNLSDNAFGPAGANAIAPFLKKLSLTSLLVNNNGLGQLGGSIIASSVKNMKKLCVFSIGRNRLEDEGAIAISEAIKFGFASSLHQFSIFQNGITKKGILALCDALSICPSLEVLDLQDNTFTLNAALVFSNGVIPVIAPSIRVLSLNDCLLTRKGSKAILEKMVASKPTFPNLALLGLQYNGISDSELDLLAQLVVQMPRLQSLQLSGNAFDPEGPQCAAFREAIRRSNEDEILDSLSDMESEVESSEEEEEIEEHVEEDIFSAPRTESPETEGLTELLEKTHVA